MHPKHIICIVLENAIFKTPKDEEFTVKVAENVEEDKELIEAGLKKALNTCAKWTASKFSGNANDLRCSA